MEAACIPRRYNECTLQTYKPAKGNGSQLLAFNYAFRLVRGYPAADRGLLSGPARYEWEHSIPQTEALRYSITFRHVRED